MTTDDDLLGPRDGDTFDPVRDTERLNRQALDVFHAIQDGTWHTLAELSAHTGHPEASISARLRDLRKARFGSHLVERIYLGDGLHAYRYGGTMTNRTRGDYLERQARDALRSCGWIVVRAAGSLGPADLVALRRGFKPLLVACKTNGKISPDERTAIVDASWDGDARPLMACRTRRGWVDLHTVKPEGIGDRIDQIKVPPRPKEPDELDEPDET
jgi:Holliday junction resolvase